MTQKQKRIKIANHLGIHWVESGQIVGPDYIQVWPAGWVDSKTTQRMVDGSMAPCSCDLPDYFNSLDAMHKAEGVLTLGQYDTFCELLGGSLYRCARATAEERAEAFGKTLNLW